jgi:non-heme chloroperoxidase
MIKTNTDISRRKILIGCAATMAVAGLPPQATAGQPKPAGVLAPQKQIQGEFHMSTITTKDGTSIFYKDWGTGPTAVFSHGWPLNADAWDAQMLFLGQQGFRVVAHDRRGHGRSGQSWNGNDYDTFADDLAALLEKVDLKDVVLVGHSMGGGEVARYIGRHGNKRVKKVVIIGGIPPVMLKSDKNPGGLPMSVFDGLRAGLVADRSQFYKDVSMPFYGYNKPDAKVSQGVRDQFWRLGMQSSVVASYECIKAFSETDFTDDLKKFDVATLIVHGDADQIVPISDSAELSSKIVKNATLKVISGAPHGLCTTHADQINALLLDFLKA